MELIRNILLINHLLENICLENIIINVKDADGVKLIKVLDWCRFKSITLMEMH